MNLVIYCTDIGSVPNRRFGWARSDPDEATIERHHGGTEIVDLVDAIAEDLAAGRAVAVGFECPLFVPVPEQPLRLGKARPGEKNRSWSAGGAWEAFVTAHAKAATHVDDATVAVAAFREALPDPTDANAVTAERPLSLLGAALL